MKSRKIGFFEVEDRFRKLVVELERRPMNEKLALEKVGELPFVLRLCISQMKAGDAAHYPEKSKHLTILQDASEAFTYKMNTCTIEEVKVQVNKAYLAFGVQ